MWLVFHNSKWSRGEEVRSLLEPWALQSNQVCVSEGQQFAIPLDLPVGVDRDGVARAVVEQLGEIGHVLTALPPAEGEVPQTNEDEV